MTRGALLADLVRALGIGLALGLAGFVLGADVPVLLWFALGIATIAGYRVVTRIEVSAGKADGLVREEIEPRAFEIPDRPFVAMRAWEERLELVRGDADYFRQEVLPRLTGLVEERLRLAYGIDPESQPERARAVLGVQLADFLYRQENGKSRPPSRAELATLVTEMEKLWTNRA